MDVFLAWNHMLVLSLFLTPAPGPGLPWLAARLSSSFVCDCCCAFSFGKENCPNACSKQRSGY